jgi:hypothetical protein
MQPDGLAFRLLLRDILPWARSPERTFSQRPRETGLFECAGGLSRQVTKSQQPSVSTPTGRSAEGSVDGTVNRTGPVDYGDYAALELTRFLTRGEHRADQGHHIEALARALAVAPRGTGRTHEKVQQCEQVGRSTVPPPTLAPAGRTGW